MYYSYAPFFFDTTEEFYAQSEQDQFDAINDGYLTMVTTVWNKVDTKLSWQDVSIECDDMVTRFGLTPLSDVDELYYEIMDYVNDNA